VCLVDRAITQLHSSQVTRDFRELKGLDREADLRCRVAVLPELAKQPQLDRPLSPKPGITVELKDRGFFQRMPFGKSLQPELLRINKARGSIENKVRNYPAGCR